MLAKPPQPYSFGYDAVNPLEGARHFHAEDSDENNFRRGSYGYTDAQGLYRRVDYVADAGGYRATVSTNEPGTAASAPADALYTSPVPVAAAI
ncbi:hypothetical protein HPB48_007350 [Haemaphysalis longicornis]|uniref:Cuticle protein n=1 Tax=Haemaphysalis longicornis TaxID=44386 RepID=A0A9J6G6I0_HAELO|nr:hypothetical protein HPB48_007350 [Haemaphysalis longicornis]